MNTCMHTLHTGWRRRRKSRAVTDTYIVSTQDTADGSLPRSLIHISVTARDLSLIHISFIVSTQDTADGSLPRSLNELYSCALSTVGPVILIVYVTPISLAGVLPVLYVYSSIFNYFRRTSREMKRLEANIRSPIYAHFTESLNGVACLRAYQLLGI